MNEVMNTIMERKSVRSYTDAKVAKEDLEQILSAGVWAPNAMNAQNWHFSVVTDEALMQKMSDACQKAMANAPVPFLQAKAKDPNFHAVFHAPAVIVITIAEGKFTLFDAGAAANGICLAAKSLGYDTCITASTEFMFMGDPGLKEVLSVPEGYNFACAITLGKDAGLPDDHVRDRKMEVVSYI